MKPKHQPPATTMIDLDQCSREALPRNGDSDCAVAARAMGLSVGDWIFGRFDHKDWWNERVLLLLWLGEELAVWQSWGRYAKDPEWRLRDRETASVTLGSRQWHRLTLPPQEIWTQEKVDQLNAYQQSGQMHPFTCGNCSQVELVATLFGWQCPNDCGWKQDWAHGFMFDLGQSAIESAPEAPRKVKGEVLCEWCLDPEIKAAGLTKQGVAICESCSFNDCEELAPFELIIVGEFWMPGE